jgi:hypothetical protein
MFIPDPEFYPSRIPDPGSRTQKHQEKRGVKKNLLSYLFCSHKFHKIENYFIFEMLKKNFLAGFQDFLEFVTQKCVTNLSKIWVSDPRSGTWKKPIPDPGPGVKKAPDPGSGSATLL